MSRSLGTSSDGRQEPVKISIPRYVLRGQGKDEHFEFEVKVSCLSFSVCSKTKVIEYLVFHSSVSSLQITVMDETWTVFRRYSRFREMHKSLKLKYPEVRRVDNIKEFLPPDKNNLSG